APPRSAPPPPRQTGSSERSSARAEPSMKASSEPIGCARDFPDVRSFLRTRARVTLLRLGRELPCLPGIVSFEDFFRLPRCLKGRTASILRIGPKKHPLRGLYGGPARNCPHFLINERSLPANAGGSARVERKKCYGFGASELARPLLIDRHKGDIHDARRSHRKNSRHQAREGMELETHPRENQRHLAGAAGRRAARP